MEVPVLGTSDKSGGLSLVDSIRYVARLLSRILGIAFSLIVIAVAVLGFMLLWLVVRRGI